MVEFKLYVEEKRLCRQDLNTCIVTGDASKIIQEEKSTVKLKYAATLEVILAALDTIQRISF